ncbi:Os09g0512950 [Oryza sativa Japonica Group]|uniref:Os09g0512950 protein n=1 Tax=Oryza sativa subsp. japonica TaxID=39947 RepID=A0A0P0XP03_ORYSJ|nr:hypothetical protein EE612_048897 [Oryza sativa]BAT08929.1 Os09g0512950 [Oryza sativa Japonica Group]
MDPAHHITVVYVRIVQLNISDAQKESTYHAFSCAKKKRTYIEQVAKLRKIKRIGKACIRCRGSSPLRARRPLWFCIFLLV